MSNRYPLHLAVAAGALAAAAVAPLNAQVDNGSSLGEDAWGIAFEFGAVSTTGNTETLSVQGKADVRQETEQWQNKYTASAIFKEDEVRQADGSVGTQKTAERYFLSARGGYKVGREHSDLFIFGSHTEDEFGAFQTYTTAAVGYGTRLLDQPAMQLDVEIGPGYYRGERVVADDALGTVEVENGAMVRGAGEFQWDFSDNAKFAQTLSVESGSDNTRTISDTSVTTKLSDTLQMKVGYSVFHNSNVAPDKEATDTTTFINLVYDL